MYEICLDVSTFLMCQELTRAYHLFRLLMSNNISSLNRIINLDCSHTIFDWAILSLNYLIKRIYTFIAF
jgi:hypothetical protein